MATTSSENIIICLLSSLQIKETETIVLDGKTAEKQIFIKGFHNIFRFCAEIYPIRQRLSFKRSHNIPVTRNETFCIT